LKILKFERTGSTEEVPQQKQVALKNAQSYAGFSFKTAWI